MYFICINQAFNNVNPVINVFIKEKEIIIKEKKNNFYRLESYYLGKVFSEIPNNITSPIIFGTLVYLIVGLGDNFLNYLTFIAILIMETLSAIYFGTFVGAIVPDA